MINQVGSSELVLLVFWEKGPVVLILRWICPSGNVLQSVEGSRAQAKWLWVPVGGAVLLPEGF